MTHKILNRDPKDEILKAFRLFDDDETGKSSFKNLKRVAKELGERMTDEELQASRSPATAAKSAAGEGATDVIQALLSWLPTSRQSELCALAEKCKEEHFHDCDDDEDEDEIEHGAVTTPALMIARCWRPVPRRDCHFGNDEHISECDRQCACIA